jgi:hypothetical protein
VNPYDPCVANHIVNGKQPAYWPCIGMSTIWNPVMLKAK